MEHLLKLVWNQRNILELK